MKKTITIALFAIISITSFAQEESEKHLRFKQTEIKGNSNSFFSELKSKGFNFTTEKQTQMTGLFAGQNVCISIDRTCISNTVYQVCAKMAPRLIWNDVESDYMLFKTNLIKKYGEPAIVKEKFIEPYRKGDGFEIKAVNNNKLEYISYWIVPEGEITIQIISGGRDLMLLIRYTDAHGFKLQEQEKTDLFLLDL